MSYKKGLNGPKSGMTREELIIIILDFEIDLKSQFQIVYHTAMIFISLR
jgi:hypothetical protein